MNHQSYWEQSTPELDFAPLTDDIRTDVCVIGAGIAGLMTAYQLCLDGKSVVVIDAGTVGSGQTRNTTAHLTNAIDDRYVEIQRWHGPQGAQLAAQSHAAAIDRIESITIEEDIDCDFERLDGYLFAPPDEASDLLAEELTAARAAGLNVDAVLRAPLPGFFTGPALRFPRQAQFHPMKFLQGLAMAVVRRGGRIFSRTPAKSIESVSADDAASGEPRQAHVKTNSNVVITVGSVVVATNSPINDMYAIHTKQAPYLSYVVGFPIPKGSVTRALYWDTLKPYHYARIQRVQSDDSGVAEMADVDLLIVGGEDHKTGQANDSDQRFSRLIDWTRQRFPVVGEPRFRWSGQVMETIDGLAFIGPNPMDESNVYVATGDSGMGMTHGAIAGMLISDLIMGRPNPWAALYNPSRKTIPAAGNFIEENLNVLRQYATWMTPGETSSIDEIPSGGGAIVRLGLKKLAVARDANGMITACSAACPHLGCLVNWNDLDKTWDCPCHGSRFNADGHVICGPAISNLTPIDELVKSS